MGAIKDRILEVAHAAPDTAVKNPDRKDNKGKLLFEIFYWQELAKEAEAQVKKLWEAAVEQKLLKADDKYREEGPGETIATESPSFSVLMKVSKARESIDKEAFLDAVAKKARIARPAIADLWEANLKAGKASLSKRVLEV